jgi:sensor histidine kinase YesM
VRRPVRTTLAQAWIWMIGNSLAGAVIGLTVGFFDAGVIEQPLIVISVLFGNVVGFTAFFSASVLFPRLRPLARPIRVLLLGFTLLTGAVSGSVAVLYAYPLFVARDLSQTAAIVALNGVLSVIVGAIVFAYENMRFKLEASLREVEEVRLAEAQLRETAARAELAALQAQINPHFFFNTLNTIASLLEDDPAAAEEVLHRLAGLFRYAFKASDTAPVALRQELEFTKDYLAIERARFGDRLRVEWDIDPDSREILVPGLLLQPLVENAIGHGIAPRVQGGQVRISSRLVDQVLHLDVIDDGVGICGRQEDLVRDGHGLGNVKRRLDAVYRGRGSLSLLNHPAKNGTVARLLLPADLTAEQGGR